MPMLHVATAADVVVVVIFCVLMLKLVQDFKLDQLIGSWVNFVGDRYISMYLLISFHHFVLVIVKLRHIA